MKILSLKNGELIVSKILESAIGKDGFDNRVSTGELNPASFLAGRPHLNDDSIDAIGFDT